jgi:hypothetical protein
MVRRACRALSAVAIGFDVVWTWLIWVSYAHMCRCASRMFKVR